MRWRNRRPARPEPIWQAFFGRCWAACFDFQLYKISNPPPVDAESVIIHPPQFDGIIIPEDSP